MLEVIGRRKGEAECQSRRFEKIGEVCRVFRSCGRGVTFQESTGMWFYLRGPGRPVWP